MAKLCQIGKLSSKELVIDTAESLWKRVQSIQSKDALLHIVADGLDIEKEATAQLVNLIDEALRVCAKL